MSTFKALSWRITMSDAINIFNRNKRIYEKRCDHKYITKTYIPIYEMSIKNSNIKYKGNITSCKIIHQNQLELFFCRSVKNIKIFTNTQSINDAIYHMYGGIEHENNFMCKKQNESYITQTEIVSLKANENIEHHDISEEYAK